jgi:hypothetical protein
VTREHKQAPGLKDLDYLDRALPPQAGIWLPNRCPPFEAGPHAVWRYDTKEGMRYLVLLDGMLDGSGPIHIMWDGNTYVKRDMMRHVYN